MAIKDSGERQEFSTGAVRDIQKGKGRCDLMPLEVVYMLLGGDSIILCLEHFKNIGSTAHLFNALRYFAERAYDNSYETMFLEASKHFEEGAEKYGENNWQSGLPTWCYLNSAIRHYLKYLRGDQDEPHDRAFVWNLMCCIWEVDCHNG